VAHGGRKECCSIVTARNSGNREFAENHDSAIYKDCRAALEAAVERTDYEEFPRYLAHVLFSRTDLPGLDTASKYLEINPATVALIGRSKG
jgi:hypothetical protein